MFSLARRLILLDLINSIGAPSAALPFLVLLLSLVGSPHCAVMCLPLTYNISIKNMKYYHTGRLLAYFCLAILTHALILLTDTVLFLRIGIGLFFLAYITYSVIKELNGGCCKVPSTPKFIRGVFLRGFFTGLLPCAWLSLFLYSLSREIKIAPLLILVFIFWVGTVPIFFIKQIRFRISSLSHVINNRYIKIVVVFLLFNMSVIMHFYKPEVSGAKNKSSASLLFCSPP